MVLTLLYGVGDLRAADRQRQARTCVEAIDLGGYKQATRTLYPMVARL